MRSIGRPDAPSALRHDRSTRAASRDFAHELVKADHEHARESADQGQDASAPGTSGKAQAGTAKVSVPAGDGSANHRPQPTGLAVAHASPGLRVDSRAAIQPPRSNSVDLPVSAQLPTVAGSAISTPALAPPVANDTALPSSLLTAAGETKIFDASEPTTIVASIISGKDASQEPAVNEAVTPSRQAAPNDLYDVKGTALSLPAADLEPSSETAEWNAARTDSGEVLQPTGITEALIGSRLYGVHLLADSYLSELVKSSSEPTGKSRDIARVMGSVRSAAVSAVEADSSSVETGLEITAPQQEEIAAVLTLLTEGNESVSISSSRTSGALSATAAEASTAFWPESSVRLTKQRDGSSVIWLRDYRAHSEDASLLVDAMVKGAHAKGLRLGRIVLNGREVWTSLNNH